MKKKIKGIWFYGLAGSGKTFASQKISKLINNSFIIDGDLVRQNVSFELGYTPDDRKKQLLKVFGITKIALYNNYFPIISTVSMYKNIFKKCKEEKILIIKIVRPMEQILKLRKIYDVGKNVVGVDIDLKDFRTRILENSGEISFENTLKSLLFEYELIAKTI